MRSLVFLLFLVLATCQNCTCQSPISVQKLWAVNDVIFWGTLKKVGQKLQGVVGVPLKGCLTSKQRVSLLNSSPCAVQLPGSTKLTQQTVFLVTAKKTADGKFATDNCGWVKPKSMLDPMDISWLFNQFEHCPALPVSCSNNRTALQCASSQSCNFSSCRGASTCDRNVCDNCALQYYSTSQQLQCDQTGSISTQRVCTPCLANVCSNIEAADLQGKCDDWQSAVTCIANSCVGCESPIWLDAMGKQVCLEDSASHNCADLSGVLFNNQCSNSTLLGYANVKTGVCAPVQGCLPLPRNVWLYQSEDTCRKACTCADFTNVDFKYNASDKNCNQALGWGFVNNRCAVMKGCTSIKNASTIRSSLYSTLDLCQISCVRKFKDYNMSANGKRPADWIEEVNGPKVAPQFSQVFPQNKVNRIDFVFLPVEWTAMQANLAASMSRRDGPPTGNFSAFPGDPRGSGGFGAFNNSNPRAGFMMGPGGPMGGPGMGGPMGGPGMGGPMGGPGMGGPMGGPGGPGMGGGDMGGALPDGTCRPGCGSGGECQNSSMGRGGPGRGGPGGGPGGPGGGPGGPGGGPVASEPDYYRATMKSQGFNWHNVGIRYKGESSLMQSYGTGIEMIGFRINLDEFSDGHPETQDQKFFGFSKMTFSNNLQDTSHIREVLAYEIYGPGGSHAVPVRVYFDIGDGKGAVFWGLYTMIEDPTDVIVRSFTNDMHPGKGNIYKPENNLWTTFVASDFEKKNNEKAANYSDVIAVFTALHAPSRRSNVTAWRAGLDAVFNVSSWLHVLAHSSVIGNWDSYPQMPHNYYLYNLNGRLTWLPWDFSLSMSCNDRYNSIFKNEVGDEYPLISFILNDAKYRQMYTEEVKRLVASNGTFALKQIIPIKNAWIALVTPQIMGLNSSNGSVIYEPERAPHTIMQDPTSFPAESSKLGNYIQQRINITFIELANEAARVAALQKVPQSSQPQKG